MYIPFYVITSTFNADKYSDQISWSESMGKRGHWNHSNGILFKCDNVYISGSLHVGVASKRARRM